MIRSTLFLGAVLGLSACAADGGKPKTAAADPASAAPGKGKGDSHDPYPSTYRADPGVATLLTWLIIAAFFRYSSLAYSSENYGLFQWGSATPPDTPLPYRYRVL